LFNNDRIVFGNQHAFVLVIPQGKTRDGKEPKTIDYEFALIELTNELDKLKKQKE